MNLFGTAGIRGDTRERVTPELALAVGRAVGLDASDRDQSSLGDRSRSKGSAVVLARDGRTAGPALLAALEAGVESAGARALRAGQLPTPALAFASRGRRGIMVTASHNPPADNGLKCFVNGQEYDRTAEQRIEARVEEGTRATTWDRWEGGERIAPLPVYREAVTEYAREHGAALEGLSVVVDCANGMASLVTPQVLGALGAEVRALHGSIDGLFPGRGSKPTPETLAGTSAFVADPTNSGNEPFDIAVAHDGDADRIVVLDGDGAIVHEDTVVAILAEHYVRGSDATDPVVVTTPNASARIDERVKAAGGRTERVRLGALHKGITVAREAGPRDTEVVFAAEPWKHVHTGFAPWIDGVASAAVLGGLIAEYGLAALCEPVIERPYEKTEVRCPDESKDGAMERLRRTLSVTFPEASVTIEHGLRLDLEAGWVLVRPSGTEPCLRIYAESERVDELLERTLEAVESAVSAVE